MASLSTHVINGAGGGSKPGVKVEVRHVDGGVVGVSATDHTGRADVASDLPAGRYRVTWQLDGFIQELSALLSMDGEGHYHVPVLASGCSAVVYLGA